MVESKSKMDRSRVFPKVGLMGFGTFIEPGIAFGNDEMNRLLVAGLSVSWELGSLYRRSNDKRIGKINLEKINVEKETFLLSTNLELTQMKNEIDRLKKLIESDLEIIQLKSEIKSAYQLKYENGICTITELLNKTNEESAAKQLNVVHEIQYMMAIYQYKTTTGN